MAVFLRLQARFLQLVYRKGVHCFAIRRQGRCINQCTGGFSSQPLTPTTSLSPEACRYSASFDHPPTPPTPHPLSFFAGICRSSTRLGNPRTACTSSARTLTTWGSPLCTWTRSQGGPRVPTSPKRSTWWTSPTLPWRRSSRRPESRWYTR